MASNHDPISTGNKASVALLRRLRAGERVHFVHRVDVCAAPPEVLVADLEPVPGTGVDDDGYGRIWYLYHAKKYKNNRGDTSGHRHRAVTGGGGASWYSEKAHQDVEGTGGGTFCNLSYGIKMGHSTKKIDRLGWCMIEYDFVAADLQQDEAAAGAAAASNYVLCKVYRSPRAKEKPPSTSSSKNTSSSKTVKKRKAGGDHPEAPPAKSIQQREPHVHQQENDYWYQPEDVQDVAVQQPTGPGGDFNFNFNIGGIDVYVDESMLRDEPAEQGVQQPIAGPETDAVQRRQRGAESEPEEFTLEWFLRGGPRQPIVEPPPGHGGEFIQMPFGPVVPAVAEATFDDMLGPGQATMYGQWSGGMTRANFPWSNYAPTTGMYTGCNSLLQETEPFQLPYLTC